MTDFKSIAAAFALGAIATPTVALAVSQADAARTQGSAAIPISDRTIWMRVSESLSAFPLGERILMAAVGRLRNGDQCGIDTGVWCEFEGTNGVLHIFDDRDVLLIKEVEIAVDGPRPSALSFLGIGTARNQTDVIRNVETFASGLAFVCEDHAEYVEDEGSTLCDAQVGGHGTISLIFTSEGKLWLVRQKALASD